MRVWAGALVCLVAACGHPAAAPKPRIATPVKRPPAAKGEIVDQGVFTIRIADTDAGEEHFTITRAAGFTFDSTFDVTTPQLRVQSKNQIVTDAAFRPVRATLQGVTNGVAFTETLTPGPPMTLDVDEGGQKHSLTAPGAVDALLADNSIVHMTAFCRRDAKPATILVFPGIETQITAAAPAFGDPSLTHRSVQASGQGQVEIYCDGDRLIAAEAAAVSMSAVRRGDEARYAKVQAKPRAKPALPDTLVELERNVTVKADKGVDAATLACSLVLPSAARDITRRPAKGALPAVLIVNDYGPEDRDGDTAGPGGVKLSLDKTLAIELGKAGIASLRCDDRGVGGSSGDFAKATLDTFAADAVAAANALRTEPAIDPKRVGYLGHGEGATVAPMAGADLPWVKAYALLGGAGRTFDLVLMDQDDHLLAKSGASDEQRKATRESSTAIAAAIKAGAPLPANTQNAQQIEQSRPWLESEFAHDPAAAIAKLAKKPVMIAHGDQDQAVTVKDSELLRDALVAAGDKAVEYHLYAGLHHWFAPAVTGDMTELADPKPQIEPRFTTDVAAFFRSRL
jgi:pimeloyl-ACP methyl ester carboxylesterase